ncbi:MAG: Ldh family oxidoreductase, partial [[Clostridium] scindens]
SMYHDLSEGRNLGQIHIVMDPSRFVGLDAFKKSMSQSLDELGEMPAAEGFGKVSYPGERAVMRRDKAYATGGVEIVDEIYDYLVSDTIHFDRYDHKNRFAE